jgi:hypothetical protein
MANGNPVGLAGDPSVPQDHRPAKCCSHCGDNVYAKGLCKADYERLRRNGHLDYLPSGKASPNYGKRAALVYAE